MRGAIISYQAGAIQTYNHVELVECHIVHDLVECPLDKGWIDGDYRPESLKSQTGSESTAWPSAPSVFRNSLLNCVSLVPSGMAAVIATISDRLPAALSWSCRRLHCRWRFTWGFVTSPYLWKSNLFRGIWWPLKLYCLFWRYEPVAEREIFAELKTSIISGILCPSIGPGIKPMSSKVYGITRCFMIIDLSWYFWYSFPF